MVNPASKVGNQRIVNIGVMLMHVVGSVYMESFHFQQRWQCLGLL